MSTIVVSLKRIWKNEYLQTAITVLLIFAIFFGFWYGSQAVLNTSYPALAVASTSMLPTLNVGDLIIIQGVPASQIKASYITGDIVVFKSPYDPTRLIVHRAVRTEQRSDGLYFITHGDNNPTGAEEMFNENDLVGRVVGRIPYAGNVPLFMHAVGDIYFYIVLMVILVVVFLALPSGSNKEDKTAEEKQSKYGKIFGKVDIGTIYFGVINVLLICLIVFNLWGSFTFWQIGSDPPQAVTIRGMYADLQYHGTFTASYNRITETYLSHGFLTYKIDSLVGGTIRPGLATFSWFQILLLVLIAYNGWAAYKFCKSKKKPAAKTETAI